MSTNTILQSIAEGELPFSCRHVFQEWLLVVIKSKSYERAALYHSLKKNGNENAAIKVAAGFDVSESTVFRDYAKHKHLFHIIDSIKPGDT